MTPTALGMGHFYRSDSVTDAISHAVLFPSFPVDIERPNCIAQYRLPHAEETLHDLLPYTIASVRPRGYIPTNLPRIPPLESHRPFSSSKLHVIYGDSLSQDDWVTISRHQQLQIKY